MGKQLREMMGGSLRPGDPRRFLIEAMVGAMNADGDVDDRELEVLQRQLEEHDLFAGLPSQVAAMLIELGNDAIHFAGGGERRVRAIANALPSRTHRLAAYAMACEVCAADENVADTELRYLDALRGALRVTARESDEIFDAASRRRAMLLLENKLQKMRQLVPLIIDCFALKVLSEGAVNDTTKNFIRDVLLSIPDITVPPSEIEQQIERAFRQSQRRRQNIDSEIDLLAMDLSDQGDRAWTMTYILYAELARGERDWRTSKFLLRLADAFEMSDRDMDNSFEGAKLFPTPSFG